MGMMECEGYKDAAADSQLTDLVGHFLQFVLRATHDDHIQPSSGQLEMKQPSNHVTDDTATHSDVILTSSA